MPYLRHTSPADSPAACSFRTLMICSSVNLLLRMSVSRRNGLYPKPRAFEGSRSGRLLDAINVAIAESTYPTLLFRSRSTLSSDESDTEGEGASAGISKQALFATAPSNHQIN